MQAIHSQPSLSQQTAALRVPLEAIAYLALVLLALLLRVAELDVVPMSEREAQDALSAWALIHPETAAQPRPAENPLAFWGQVLGFSLLGGTEFAARLSAALGGVALGLMPLLFRPWVGAGRAFLMSVLLYASPIALVASRTAEPMVWTMVLALLLLWALWRYIEAPSHSRALWLAGSAGLLLLWGQGGLWLIFILGGALALALWWTAFNAPDELDASGDVVFQRARTLWQDFPLAQAAWLVAGLVFIAGTFFMLYPSGLGVMGNNLGASLAALWTPAHPQMPALVGLGTLLVYELPLLIFALLGLFALQGLGLVRLPERLAFMVFALGVLVLTFLQGATPAWAMWLSLPLIWIASAAAYELLAHRPTSVFWFGGLDDDDEELFSYRYNWVKWFLGLVAFTLFVTLVLHLQEVGRGLLAVPTNQPLGETLSLMFSETLGQFRYSLVWTFVTVIFFVVGFFLVASIWGNDHALQGLGLGALALIVLGGLGTGWNASVTMAAHPAEYWHIAEGGVSADAPLLRRTIQDVAQRETRGFPNLPLVVVQDAAQGIRPDGLMGWLLRDFTQTRWVDSLEAARGAEIVIAPRRDEAASPDLGGSYVGQSFALRQRWGVDGLHPLDALGWWLTRRLRSASAEAVTTDGAVLWLRMDIYDSSGDS